MPSRDEIISKLKKFSQMTTANGCSEAEANFAMERMVALMAEYNITQTEIEIKSQARDCLKDYFAVLSGRRADWMDCATAIAKATETKCWSQREWDNNPLGLGSGIGAGYITKMYFFGLPTDVNYALALCLIVSNAITTEAERYIQERKARRERTYKPQIESFCAGIVDRLRERLKDMAPKPIQATGQGLIVLKNQLITEEWAKLNLRLKSVGRSTRISDPNAHAAGVNAGTRVGLTPTSHQTYGARQIAHQK